MAPFLQMQGVSKRFHNTQALRGVSVDFERGEIHVVIGENGAGKSTLMGIAAGLHRPDGGGMRLNGAPVSFSSPRDAIARRIAMIHQELLPIPDLTVAQNIYLGREPLTAFGSINHARLDRDAGELFESMGIDINPRKAMRGLGAAQTQLVEIAKAVSFHSEFLIMDEPTSALSGKEIDGLYRLIFRLKAEGVAIVFISHKLDEVFRVADRITVLRDGELAGTRKAAEVDKDALIAMMIGRDLGDVYPKAPAAIGEPILEVEGLTRRGDFEDIGFTLRRGEILGIAGLMGAGRTELVESIFGLRRMDSGRILVRGREARIRGPHDAKKHGLALIPEDRKLLGLNLKASVGFNISLCNLRAYVRGNRVNRRLENAAVDAMIAELGIKAASRDAPVVSLSGGNQQKAVIAKWLMTLPDILILDEPTRGIDIGAKAEIYKLIASLARGGKSIILVSSELPEIIGLSDRVLVLCEGRLKGVLRGERINQRDIMRCATNQLELVG